MTGKEHWEEVYTQKRPNEVSWFVETASMSLSLIHLTDLTRTDPIIDVGGGASRLVDALFEEGFESVCVLDISAAALKAAQDRLGSKADAITWLEADLTKPQTFATTFRLWHDRAVFHFMTTPEQRTAYKNNLRNALKPAGFAIIATFSETGPEKCSGLPVQRYSAESLSTELGQDFKLLNTQHESHTTPWGSTQDFVYCLFKYCP